MKSKVCRRVVLLVLSMLSLSVHAHDSLQALQQGGTLAKLAAELLHPLLEAGVWEIVCLAFALPALLWFGVKRCAEFVMCGRLQTQRIRRSERSR
jgi:hypothetical protein